MNAIINFYSEEKGQIKKFLNLYNPNYKASENALFWKKEFFSPIDMIDIMSCFIDNNEKFNMNLWISLDKDVLINVTDNNADKIIRYLFERYPY